MADLRYRRVLLKISGELVGQPDGGGIDIARLRDLSQAAREFYYLATEHAYHSAGNMTSSDTHTNACTEKWTEVYHCTCGWWPMMRAAHKLQEVGGWAEFKDAEVDDDISRK